MNLQDPRGMLQYLMVSPSFDLSVLTLANQALLEKESAKQRDSSRIQMGFLPDQTSRKHLVLPTQVNVDFRAACFCHKRVVDIGFVCSICLSSTSSFPIASQTCSDARPPSLLLAAGRGYLHYLRDNAGHHHPRAWWETCRLGYKKEEEKEKG